MLQRQRRLSLFVLNLCRTEQHRKNNENKCIINNIILYIFMEANERRKKNVR